LKEDAKKSILKSPLCIGGLRDESHEWYEGKVHRVPPEEKAKENHWENAKKKSRGPIRVKRGLKKVESCLNARSIGREVNLHVRSKPRQVDKKKGIKGRLNSAVWRWKHRNGKHTKNDHG